MEGGGLPGGCKDYEEFKSYVQPKILKCMREYMSKEEILKHLWDEYQIVDDSTNHHWDLLEKADPFLFISYYQDCERNRRLREHDAPTSTLAMTISKRAQQFLTEKRAKEAAQQRQLLTCSMGSAQNVQREGASSSSPVHALIPVEELQASQQPVSPRTEFRKQVLSALAQIQSNTEKILKIMTDNQTDAARPRKRKRQEQEQVRGDTTESDSE